MKKPFTTIDGIPVFIDSEDGRFTARINGKNVTRSKLSELQKMLGSKVAPVTAYELNGDIPDTPTERRIIRFEKGRARFEGNYLDRPYQRYFILTEADQKAIKALNAEQSKLEQAWMKLIKTLTRLDEQNIEEHRNA